MELGPYFCPVPLDHPRCAFTPPISSALSLSPARMVALYSLKFRPLPSSNDDDDTTPLYYYAVPW